MNQFFAVGLKLLAAAGVGVAVYLGIDKAVSSCEKKQNSQRRDMNNNNSESPEQCSNCSTSQVGVSTERQQPSSGEKLVSGLRVAQDVFGRAFSLCQNLAMAADNIVKIFGNNHQDGYNQPGGYGYNNSYQNGYQDKYKDPPGYRRLSPFILEYVEGPVDSRCYNQAY